MVDFPDAERPVNQIVKPRCLRNSLRSWREREGCQVMLLFSLSVLKFARRGWRGSFLRCHCACLVLSWNVKDAFWYVAKS